jgi:DNA mismatch endonuclease (patch repair protein)
MADVVSPAKRSSMMSGIKSENTRPELHVRKVLHRLGYRFRLHRKDLPGKPDIVLPRYKTALFVHGCFWHGHEDCTLFRLPHSREEFWSDKISANRARDKRSTEALQKLGWKTFVVWECAIKGRSALSEGHFAQLLNEGVLSTERAEDIRGMNKSSNLGRVKL